MSGNYQQAGAMSAHIAIPSPVRWDVAMTALMTEIHTPDLA